MLFPLYHSSSQWSKTNLPALDAAIVAGRNTLDEAKRLAAYKTALTLIHDDVQGVPLYQDVMMFAAKKEVKWQPTPNEAFFLMDMSWAP